MTSQRVLVVDDEEAIRRGLARILTRAGHDCATAASADEAVGLLGREQFALVLTDVTMPGRSGLWLATYIAGAHPDTAVVMVTGVDDTDVANNALDVGAYGYVIKPFEANEIVINVANALRRRTLELDNRTHRDNLERLVRERTGRLASALERLAAADQALRQSHEESIRRLAHAAEFHDPATGIHLERMSLYSEALARAAGLDAVRCELVRMASPMHDIGKIGIPDHILRKPGRLSDDEIAVMRTHPEIGAELLAGSDSELLRLGRVIALNHHERYDGTGYPHRLSGDDIPLEGRIVAIADVFDALTSARPYKAAIPFDEAYEMMARQRGLHFDAYLVDAFVDLSGELSDIAARTAADAETFAGAVT